MTSLTKLSVLALSAALTLAACGGGGDQYSNTTGSNTVVAISTTNKAQSEGLLSALAGQSFTYGAGVSEFGTTGATTVTITPSSTTGAAAGFKATSGTDEASGPINLGSCKFTVENTTFKTGALSIKGNVITIANCTITLATGGQSANGAVRKLEAALGLNNAKAGTQVNVTIENDGTVKIGNTVVTKLKVDTVTGTV